MNDVMTHSRWLLIAAVTLVFAACGGETAEDDDNTNTDTGGDDVGMEDTGGEDTTMEDAGGDTSMEDTGGEDTGVESPYDEAAIYFECDTSADCLPIGDQEQICVNHVCVIPPTERACLGEELDDGESVVEHCDEPEYPIELNCLDPESPDYNYATPDGPDTATVAGEVERFGSGSPTVGLCITAYDESLVLPFLYFSECRALEDEDDEAFIGCFQLDVCRCNAMFDGSATSAIEDMVVAAEDAWGEDIDSLEACYTFIGYCSAIPEGADRDACVERLRAQTLDDTAETLVIASSVTTLNEEDPTSDSGLYSLEGIPTNTRLAFKTSGRESRWRDTWEYGLYARADLVVDGVYTLEANAVGDGAWRTIPPAVGLATGIDETHGALAGVIRDCGTADRDPWPVVHGTVGISFDATKLAYFNGNPNDTLPLPGRIDTNVLGTYAAIDLPSGPNRVSPVICVGDCSSEEDFFFAGTLNTFQTPKSIIIATFEGLY